jgi:hypothetical protein
LQSEIPKNTQRTNVTFVVDNPELIPACYLLPPDGKKYDKASYPRIAAAVKATGLSTKIPGITVKEDTQTILR